MNEPTDQNPSPLDPELLRELEAAEAGSGSSLLDDAPLLPAYQVDDDTPLAPVDPDFGVLPADSQGSAPSDFLGGDDRAEEPAGASSSDEGMMDAGGVAAPMPTEVLDRLLAPDQEGGALEAERAGLDTPPAGRAPEDPEAGGLADMDSDPERAPSASFPPAPADAAAPPVAPAFETEALSPERGAGAGEDTLSQEELESLLAAAVGKGALPESAGAPTESVSALDLEQLLDSAVSSLEPGAGAAGPEVAPEDDLDSYLDSVLPADGGVPAGAEDVLDQSSIDSLLSASGGDESLAPEGVDGPMGGPFGGESALEAPGFDADAGLPGDASPPDVAGDLGSGVEISQDMIDALIASAQAEAPAAGGSGSESAIGSENLAAAATASSPDADLLSPSDLDRLIEESRRPDWKRPASEGAAPEMPAPEASAGAVPPEAVLDGAAVAARTRRFRKPGVIIPFVRRHPVRLAASLLAGLIAAAGTGAFLWSHREFVPRGPGPSAIQALEVVIERAREEMARGDFAAAIEELEGPLSRALPSALRADGQYLLLEARYRGFRGAYGTPPFDTMVAQIEAVVEQLPNHARAPEALAWEARLYTPELPYKALDIYRRIIQEYSTGPGMDGILRDAARLALENNQTLDAAIFARDLLRRFPGSPHAGDAMLTIADTNVRAGNMADARATYVRMAESEPNSRLGAQAYLRLARLAFEAGQYGQAIMHLTRRLETTTTTEGNDEVYLLLAQAYRASGQLNEARDTLSDLLNLFEPGPVTPRAYVEYTQVLEALGDRERALRTARRAALEYPNAPEVLRNQGEFEGLTGNALPAAIAFVAADRAGAGDPNLLLAAARYYRTANMPREAAAAFGRLKTYYGGSPASIQGGIEAAELRYAEGAVEGAIADLKSLQAATRGTEHHLPAVQSLLGIYQDLGLSDHITALAGEVAQLAEEPEVVARAALDLMRAGELERAQAAISRIDLARLKERTAFDLLMREGEALLAVAPQRGLEKMEAAFFNYPAARTREADQKLLDTYLRTGRAAAARRMVMDLKAGVEQRPADAPYLIDAAIAWGDYLYDREDYRTAVFAYTLAEEAGFDRGERVAGMRSTPEWARYQRANALLRLADYAGCLPLYEAIAASDSPWAGEAAVKATAARLEQRQRGVSVAAG